MAQEKLNTFLTAGIVLGAGLGGFVDGILFHQILQIHNMLSAVYPPDTLLNVEVNMFWDGLFHAGTWIATAIGVGVLWQGVARDEAPPSTLAFLGSLLAGWGLFNFIEGIIDHYLLGIHHVVERFGASGWDALFVLSGLLLIGAGFALMRSRELTPR